MIKETNKNTKAFKLAKEVLYNSFAQALLKFVETSNNLLKVFIFFFLLVLISLASFMTVETCMSYFSYEVTTTTRTIFETTSILPQVTFCNINFFTTKYAHEFLSQINSSYNFVQNESLYESLNSTEINRFYFEVKSLIRDKKITNETLQKLSHSLDDILFGCSFNFKNCSSKDFIWIFNRHYGNCYVYNSGFDSQGNKVDSLANTSFSGSAYGLYLEIYVKSYEKLSLFNSVWVHNSGSMGGLVRLSNNSRFEEQTYFNDGIKLASGFQTDVQVERVLRSMKPKPYSNCEIDSGNKYSYRCICYNK